MSNPLPLMPSKTKNITKITRFAQFDITHFFVHEEEEDSPLESPGVVHPSPKGAASEGNQNYQDFQI